MAKTKREARIQRKKSIRQKVGGTPERPRLTVFRSLRHIYVQVIDDESNRVLASVSTRDKALRGEFDGKKKIEQAQKIGTQIATVCKAKGVGAVVFDRNGYKYHGRVLAVAKAAREAGLQF